MIQFLDAKVSPGTVNTLVNDLYLHEPLSGRLPLRL
jgi:hypothetical protein